MSDMKDTQLLGVTVLSAQKAVTALRGHSDTSVLRVDHSGGWGVGVLQDGGL